MWQGNGPLVSFVKLTNLTDNTHGVLGGFHHPQNKRRGVCVCVLLLLPPRFPRFCSGCFEFFCPRLLHFSEPWRRRSRFCGSRWSGTSTGSWRLHTSCRRGSGDAPISALKRISESTLSMDFGVNEPRGLMMNVPFFDVCVVGESWQEIRTEGSFPGASKLSQLLEVGASPTGLVILN